MGRRTKARRDSRTPVRQGIIRQVSNTVCVGDRVELESSRVSVAGNVDEQARTRTQAKHTHARAHQNQAVPFFVSLFL